MIIKKSMIKNIMFKIFAVIASPCLIITILFWAIAYRNFCLEDYCFDVKTAISELWNQYSSTKE